MKKLILTVAISATLFASCEKKEDVVNEVSRTQKETFLKPGTVLEPSKSVRNSISYSHSNGKVSWTIFPPYASQFPQVAKGIYAKGEEVARSANGMYALIYQPDGNLVLYKLAYANGPTTLPALWATNAYNSQPTYDTFLGTLRVKVEFHNDGNIICRDYYNNIYWTSSYTSSPNPIWILQDDGNFVGYKDYIVSGNGSITTTGASFASTATDGGRVSNYFGTIKK